MAIVGVNGVSISIEGLDGDAGKLRQFTNTLGLMPVPHLRHIPTITVGDRPARGGGGSASPSMPGGPFIRINRTSFESAWNRGVYHYTLLHEAGHIINWAYDCMRKMQLGDPAGYRALLNHPHRGATHGPGEHYADGYADFLNILARRRMTPARLQAILGSEAFRSLCTLDLFDLPPELRP